MKKNNIETAVVGIGTLLLGVVLIIVGCLATEKIWFTATMIICGTFFSINAVQYLEKNFKKRDH